jgi:hypothetical protein
VSETSLRRLALLAATAVALTVQVSVFTAGPPDLDDADGATYLAPARNLAAGRGVVALVYLCAGVMLAV